MTLAKASVRVHLDVQAMLQQLKETRGRPAFRCNSGRRDAAIDGCFSRPASMQQPHVDRPMFQKLLRTVPPSPQPQTATRSSSGRRSASMESQSRSSSVSSHRFPFRSSSKSPGIPQRESVLVSDVSPAYGSEAETPHADAATVALLTRRDVNRKVSSDVEVSYRLNADETVERTCRRRYAVMREALTPVRAPLRGRRGSASPAPQPSDRAVPAVRPADVWLHVNPDNADKFCGVLSRTAFLATLSYLDEQTVLRLAHLSSAAREAIRSLSLSSGVSDSCDVALVAQLVPDGYWTALAFVENDEAVPRSTKLVGSLLAARALPVQELPQDVSVMWPLFRERVIAALEACVQGATQASISQSVLSEFFCDRSHVNFDVLAHRCLDASGFDNISAFIEACTLEDPNAAILCRLLLREAVL